MSDAPGWDAIDAALRAVYGDRQRKHYGTIVKAAAGGQDPLDGISVYARDDGAPHWHFVTYGLSDLYGEATDDAGEYSFELTFRLARAAGETEPPKWPLDMLQNLARYVFTSGNDFEPGHHMTLNGPIAVGRATEITAVLFVADPELPATTRPHGAPAFVQVVGITADELEAVEAWRSDGLAEILAASNRLLITDVTRGSVLRDAAIARRVREGAEREGSSLGALLVTTAEWERHGLLGRSVRLTLGARAVASLIRQLRGRLMHGRPLVLQGKGGAREDVTRFEPAATASVRVAADGLVVAMPPSVAAAVSERLRPESGTYRWDELPKLEIIVIGQG